MVILFVASCISIFLIYFERSYLEIMSPGEKLARTCCRGPFVSCKIWPSVFCEHCHGKVNSLYSFIGFMHAPWCNVGNRRNCFSFTPMQFCSSLRLILSRYCWSCLLIWDWKRISIISNKNTFTYRKKPAKLNN